jgi:(S)-sulfolactate dehydrogenase
VNRPADLAEHLTDAKALIVRNRTQVTSALIDAAPLLVAIGRLGVGLDNIDQDACTRRGIAVLPATGANTIAVAEWVIATILILMRGAFTSSDKVLDGSWPREQLAGAEIYGKKLGLVGFGGIARETARRAAVMGMELVAYDPFVPKSDAAWTTFATTPVDFDTLLSSSDAISLHVPFTAQTKHMIAARELKQMKPTAIIVNAARGGVIDEAALAAALKAGSIGGAALDVYENEPLPAGSALVGTPRLILTPHVAGVTTESNVRVSAVTAANIRKALAGRT